MSSHIGGYFIGDSGLDRVEALLQESSRGAISCPRLVVLLGKAVGVDFFMVAVLLCTRNETRSRESSGSLRSRAVYDSHDHELAAILVC